MSDLRTAAQIALDALLLEATEPPIPETAAAIESLRAALAADPQPVAHTSTCGDIAYGVVKWVDQNKRPRVGTPLYTAAPTPQPLTDEQIKVIHNELCDTVGSDFKTVARAIERAHGIGGTHG